VCIGSKKCLPAAAAKKYANVRGEGEGYISQGGIAKPKATAKAHSGALQIKSAAALPGHPEPPTRNRILSHPPTNTHIHRVKLEGSSHRHISSLS